MSLKVFCVVFVVVQVCLGCHDARQHHSKRVLEILQGDTALMCYDYLVENMNGHGCYAYVNRDRFDEVFFDFTKTITQKGKYRKVDLKKLMDKIAYSNVFETKLVADNDVVGEGFLTKHVEQMMAHWKGKWAKHLSFEEFKRFLLPYRVNNEAFEDYSTFFKEELPWIRELNSDSLSAFEACAIINDTLVNRFAFFSDFDNYPRFAPSQVWYIGGGTCQDLTNFTTLLMRYAGLPVASVLNREGHFANVLLDENGALVHFQGGEQRLKRGKGVMYGVKSKIYLKTFHQNKSVCFLQELYEDGECPKRLVDVRAEDITKELLPCFDIQPILDSDKVIDSEVLFLLSNNSLKAESWMSVAWGRVSDRKVAFKNVGVDNVYMVAAYDGTKYLPFSNPFHLTKNGEMRYFRPDFSNVVDISARRKSKIYWAAYRYSMQLKGCVLQGSNDARFQEVDILDTIGRQYLWLDGETFSAPKKYKFFRLFSQKKELHVAELFFFNTKGDTINGDLVFSENTANGINAFDGDVSSYSSAKGKGSWIGLKTSEPVNVGSFKVLFRNGLDVIENGSSYDLFYWDEEWIHFGESTAKAEAVLFEKVPGNSLFYVRDQKGGVNSMAFWVEGNEQKWVRMLPKGR